MVRWRPWGKINVYRTVVGKPDGKIPRGRPKSRWKDTIEMNLEEIGWKALVWLILAQDRHKWPAVVNTILSLRVS
jgi:hypothetical protein